MCRKKGLTLLEVLVLVLIIAFMLFIILAAPPGCFTSPRAEIKIALSVIAQGIAAYEGDLGVFPADHSDIGTNANPTPTKPAFVIGIFDTKVTNYFADNLMRHLDGDTSNDMDTGENDLVSVRHLDNYLGSLRSNQIDTSKPNKPIIKTRYGTTIKYNELASEKRTISFQKDNPDPRQSFVFFDSFQLYTEADDTEAKNPKRWIATFRE